MERALTLSLYYQLTEYFVQHLDDIRNTCSAALDLGMFWTEIDKTVLSASN